MSFAPVKPREYGTTKQVFGELMREVGGAKEAAFMLGKSLTRVYGYADESVPDANVSFDAVRRLTRYRVGAYAAAEALAFDARGYFTPVAPSPESGVELLARVPEETGAVLADLVRRASAARAGGPDPLLTEHIDALLAALIAVRGMVAP